MANKMVTASSITMRTYLAVLERASKNTLPTMDLIDEDLYPIVAELSKSGLLSEMRDESGFFNKHIRITPEGCSALEEWSNYLKQSSFAYKVLDNLLRFLWVVVGALAATIPSLLTGAGM